MLGQRGDTIIEVLLAFTVFALVSVGALSIMNQGTNSAQRSLEAALVKQQIDAQAEALRAAHKAHGVKLATKDATTSAWEGVIASADSSTLAVTGATCPAFSGSNNIFIMNGRTGVRHDAVPTSMASNDPNLPPYSRVVYRDPPDSTVVEGAFGLWIEKQTRTAPVSGIPAAYDFTIKACWYGPGQTAPMQLQTVVRLHDYA